MEHPDEDPARHAQKRFETFLDCIAYLLARRWLRDEHQREEQQSEKEHRPANEEAE